MAAHPQRAEVSGARALAVVLLWALILAYALTFGALALRRHAAFLTNGYDLGNVDQALWNTAHGRFLAFTNMAPVENRLALHVEPILLLFVPFYLLGSGPEILLVAQAMVVALGALPAFWLARKRLGSDYAGLVFAAAYLLFPALEAATLFDFHALTLAAPLLLLAFHALEVGQLWRFALFALLAASCKQDVALVLSLMGVYALLTGRPVMEGRGRQWRYLVGTGTAILGLAWFLVAIFVVQPPFSPVGENIHLSRYAWLGDSPLGIVRSLITQPGLVWEHLWVEARLAAYLSGLTLPLAFLPLLSPGVLLVAVPSLAANLLSDYSFMWRLEEFHYAAPLVPVFLVAAIYGVERVANLYKKPLRHQDTKDFNHFSSCLCVFVIIFRTIPKRLRVPGRAWNLEPAHVLCTLVLAFSLLYHYYRGFSPLARPFYWPVVTPHHHLARDFAAMIPANAALLAQINLNPHVSQRQKLYQDFAWVGEADTIFLDAASLGNKDDVHRYIRDELLGGKDFGLVAAGDGYLLLRRGAPGTPLPDAFYTFARSGTSGVQYPMQVDFGDALRLVGFDLAFYREEEVVPTLYWQVLRPLDRDYRIALYLLDEGGAVVGATTQEQPLTVWLPTSRWRAGETVRFVGNTLPWYTRDRSRYGLAVGVIEGDDPWAVGARLRPRPGGSGLAPWLPADGTLLQLMRFRKVGGMPEAAPDYRSFQPAEMDSFLDASLGGQVRLLGYRWGADTESVGLWRRLYCLVQPASCAPVGAERSLHFTLYWQALGPMDISYTVFAHLIGEDGRPVAQRDGPPGGSRLPPERGQAPIYPTNAWLKGEVMADPYTIPIGSDVPPGRYTLIVGMYRGDTRERLPFLGEDGQARADHVVLGDVQVP
jgi:uncharacterized membrane protein